MEAYKKWVRRNKDYLHSLESLANGLTWLLPERFSESEIGPEAVTAILGVITAINEHIIDTTPIQTQKGFVEPSSSPWSLCVSTLKELETLVEVVAQHLYGDDKKWNFIAVTEATKVLVRLALFRNSGYKMLLHGGDTLNSEKGPNNLASQHGMGGITRPGGHLGPGNNYGRGMQNLEGRALSALSRFGENARMVSAPTLSMKHEHQLAATLVSQTSAVKRPTLSTILSERGLYGGLFLMAEALHISRPLIYVLFIRKYGVRSWIPWLLSLGVDLTGLSLLLLVKHPLKSRRNGHLPLSDLEKNEVKRRKLLLAFYLMRDPFFHKYTRQRFENTEKLLEHVPIVGFLTAKLVELVIGAQTRYTYMSGS
ncbi:Peroxisome biogenesis protein [Thalictrum thalictroides]|uniref:Peroxisomal membrane protein PEX16 n=1 Tax=Thalictrum thalictroides TaxID=46969 RepID=A0A7J6URL6_THATH|nr:Peroxisome biogenesis protein [Thalictrum thalictroides]